MKIIRRGSPESNRIWRGTCHSCGSIAEAEENELTSIVHDQRDGSFSWEDCPVCNAKLKCNGDGAGMLFQPK